MGSADTAQGRVDTSDLAVHGLTDVDPGRQVYDAALEAHWRALRDESQSSAGLIYLNASQAGGLKDRVVQRVWKHILRLLYTHDFRVLSTIHRDSNSIVSTIDESGDMDSLVDALTTKLSRLVNSPLFRVVGGSWEVAKDTIVEEDSTEPSAGEHSVSVNRTILKNGDRCTVIGIMRNGSLALGLTIVKRAKQVSKAEETEAVLGAPVPTKTAQDIDSPQDRAKAVDAAFRKAPDRAKRMKIVVGVANGDNHNRMKTTALNIGRILADRGFSLNAADRASLAQAGDNHQIITYAYDPEDMIATMDDYEKTMRALESEDCDVVALAPKNAVVPEQVNPRRIIIRDAYKDCDPANGYFPDIAARVAIARNLVNADPESIAVIRDLLNRISSNTISDDVTTLEGLVNYFTANPLSIKPVDYNGDFLRYRESQYAMATSA